MESLISVQTTQLVLLGLSNFPLDDLNILKSTCSSPRQIGYRLVIFSPT